MALPAQSPPVAPQPLPPAQAHQPTPQPRVESHATDALGRKAADLYNRQMYAEAIDALDQRMRSMPETTDLRLIRAWSLMNLNRNEEARRVFSTLSNVRRAVALETEPAKTGNR